MITQFTLFATLAQVSAPTAATPNHGALAYVAVVNLVIWAGLFGYMLYLDRRVRSAENARGSEKGTR